MNVLILMLASALAVSAFCSVLFASVQRAVHKNERHFEPFAFADDTWRSLHLNDFVRGKADCNFERPLCKSDVECGFLCSNPFSSVSCVGHRCRVSPLSASQLRHHDGDCAPELGCKTIVEVDGSHATQRRVHMNPLVNAQRNLLNPITFRHATLRHGYDYRAGSTVNDNVICKAGFRAIFLEIAEQKIKFCVAKRDAILRSLAT